MIVEQIWTGNAYRNFNYLIACPESGEALAVDPLDHKKCLARARERGWEITQILNTYEHGDHTGGNKAMIAATAATVVNERIMAVGYYGPPGAAASAGSPATGTAPSSRCGRRSVLGCINADFCIQILILQLFLRSTRFSHFRTALNAKFQQIPLIFSQNFNKVCKCSEISQDFDKNDALSGEKA